MCRTLSLKTNSHHKIGVSITGDESKIPVVVLHGGPGSKSKPKHVAKYDFDNVYTIQIDQRGCGESTPNGNVENNTTNDLLEDIELVRNELNIDKWIVSGASWGSTLALLYAEANPEKVLGLYLGSVFLARERDSEWLLKQDGATRFFPDVWDEVQSMIENSNVSKDNTMDQIYEMLQSEDFEQQQIAGAIVGSWERNLISMDTNFEYSKAEDLTEEDLNAIRVFVHYDVNNFFIEENQILNNIDKIKDIPTVFVHGRFDVICPPEQAYEVHKRLSNSTLEFTSHDGHSLGSNAQIIKKYLFKELLEKINHQ